MNNNGPIFNTSSYHIFDTPSTLAEHQQSIETLQYARAVAEATSKLQTNIDGHTEYYLNYGKSAILEMLEPAIQFTSDRYSKKNQHLNLFYWEIIKPRYDSGLKPEVELAHLVVIELASSLSSGLSLVNLSDTLRKKAFRIFNTIDPTNEQIQGAYSYLSSMVFHIAETTDIFSVTQSDGREYRLELSPQWYQFVEQEQNELNLTISAYRPMVIKPKFHYSLTSGEGGYIYSDTPLLKHPFKNRMKELEGFNNPLFFEFINSIQSTPYCINKKLLSILTEYHSNGFYFKDYPVVIDYTEADEQAIKDLNIREERRKVYAVANETTYKPLTKASITKHLRDYRQPVKDAVMKTLSTLEEAEFFSDFKEIYYPVFVDYRGRIYPYASGKLSYQGSELEKALLHFAKKESVTESGLYAMFETLGNTLGNDKVISSVKVVMAKEWFNANVESFMEGDWSVFFDNQDEFEEPINALAICIELCEIINDPNYKTGYISHRDARCSGPSIMSVMLGDEKVMGLTGVIDRNAGERLTDVYTEVAEEGRRVATEMGLDLPEECFSRKVFKLPVMTGSYGQTDFGLREYVKESKLPSVMFDVITKAMDGALPCCAMYKELVGNASKKQAKELDHCFFINPITAFPVAFTKLSQKEISINVKAGIRSVRLKIKLPSNTVVHESIKTSSIPNVLHNIDSTVLYMVESQVRPFGVNLSVIHDSIGCHPNYTKDVILGYNKALEMLVMSDCLNCILKQFDGDATAPRNTLEIDFNSHHVLV